MKVKDLIDNNYGVKINQLKQENRNQQPLFPNKKKEKEKEINSCKIFYRK